jgi:hypothetical protein
MLKFGKASTSKPASKLTNSSLKNVSSAIFSARPDSSVSKSLPLRLPFRFLKRRETGFFLQREKDISWQYQRSIPNMGTVIGGMLAASLIAVFPIPVSFWWLKRSVGNSDEAILLFETGFRLPQRSMAKVKFLSRIVATWFLACTGQLTP